MITKRVVLIVVPAILAVLSFWGCDSTSQPLEPERAVLQRDAGDLITGYYSPADTILLRVCERERGEIGKSEALIGPDGGLLSRADHHLVIPPGALDRTVEISFIIPRTRYLECMLEPHGLEFSLPVSLVLSYDGICDDNGRGADDDLNESEFKVAYFNPDSQIWEAIPTAVDTVLNTATGSLEGIVGFTDHFSRYGIIKR